MLLSDGINAPDNILNVVDNYFIKTDAAPFLILRVGYLANKASFDFDSVKMLARKVDILEFKHYRKNGSKFWTSKLGAFLYFAIPKDKIEIVPKEGYSYPTVIIGGQEITLSVSGGGGGSDGGWTDWVSGTSSTSVNMPKKKLNAIVNAAMFIGDAKRHGITLDFDQRPSWIKTDEDWAKEKEREARRIHEHACKYTVMPLLDEGWRIHLNTSWSIEGSHGPFIVCAKPKGKQHVRIGRLGSYGTKIMYKMIDWTKTAALNGDAVKLPSLVNMNRVAPAAE